MEGFAYRLRDDSPFSSAFLLNSECSEEMQLPPLIEGEGVDGHLYAESLADALAIHILRRTE